jgi:1A family penicillin-binding protein
LSQRVRSALRRIWRHARRDPSRPARAWARAHWRALALLGVSVSGALAFDAWLYTCGLQGCPSTDEIRSFRPAEGGRVLDRFGESMGRMVAVRRINVPLDQVPLHVRQAFLATEDRRFYSHHGVDWRAMLRAASRNVRAAGVREGFSTITMQVARNTFVARRFGERSLARKLMEMRVAGLLERTIPKDRILEHYLNVIYLGNGVFGVEAASRDLFAKGVDELSVDEGAMLAALPKGPSAYTPRRNPRRALARRNLVIDLMVREGFLDSATADEARDRDIQISDDSWRPDPADASYALDLVRAMVDSVLTTRGLEMGDVTVRTTLDARAQRAADDAVEHRASEIEDETGHWSRRGQDALQGAMVALDPRSGDIRALVGGRGYQPGGFNRAVDAHRQPGSAFKPFVYAAALAAGLSPASFVDDQPIEIDQGGRKWTPANFDGRYAGRITLRSALMRSANSATIRVSRAVGESRVIDAARRNGITSPLQPVPAIALGALEVTPLELVAAYAPFANGGYRVRPRIVSRIEAADGTVLWKDEPERIQVMDPRDAWQLTSMLRSAVDHGTGHAVREAGVDEDIPVAGKTGTTNSGTDVWFVGYTPTLVAGFWFGYDTPRPIGAGAAGGRFAAPAWAEFYREAWSEKDEMRDGGDGGEVGRTNSDGGSDASADPWAPPPGMVMREIDSQTGELATEWCPLTQREWFRPGTEPTEPCRAHAGRVPPTWTAAIERRLTRAFKRLFRF